MTEEDLFTEADFTEDPALLSGEESEAQERAKQAERQRALDILLPTLGESFWRQTIDALFMGPNVASTDLKQALLLSSAIVDILSAQDSTTLHRFALGLRSLLSSDGVEGWAEAFGAAVVHANKASRAEPEQTAKTCPSAEENRPPETRVIKVVVSGGEPETRVIRVRVLPVEL